MAGRIGAMGRIAGVRSDRLVDELRELGLADGADLLVIGRPITGADDVASAAAAIAASLAG